MIRDRFDSKAIQIVYFLAGAVIVPNHHHKNYTTKRIRR
jgi:hypothetical protein